MIYDMNYYYCYCFFLTNSCILQCNCSHLSFTIIIIIIIIIINGDLQFQIIMILRKKLYAREELKCLSVS